MHIAAQTYRQNGNDYWPGPLDGSDTLTYATSTSWAKIWKVNRTDIQDFLALTTHNTSNTPQSILTWPAKGNVNAQGNGGAALTITNDMAPFVDINSNGIYEPLLGEYPDVKGDQALWWVFSDNGATHTETHGRPLGVEVQAMSYAYSRGTLIDNVVYYYYKIINRSPDTYHNFRAALRADIDLGYYADDYIGFDSSHRLGIVYNGITDDGLTAGHPLGSYGDTIPVMGVTIVSSPGDAGSSYVPVGSFTYYNNDFSIIGNPVADTEYNNYMRSRLRNGQHFTDDFSGPGGPSVCYGTGPDCNYVYTGDPSVSAEWSECACNNSPGDRRFILSSSDFTMAPGEATHFVLALVASNPELHNGSPTVGFDSIKVVADTAWSIYQNPPMPLAVANIGAAARNVTIFPNPNNGKMTVMLNGKGYNSLQVYDCIGRIVYKAALSGAEKTSEIDMSGLPAGTYYLHVVNSAGGDGISFVINK